MLLQTVGERTFFERFLFCVKHLISQLAQTLCSSSGPALTWDFASMTTFKQVWVENQAHETPTNYPGDPFEGLRHNVAKDALPGKGFCDCCRPIPICFKTCSRTDALVHIQGNSILRDLFLLWESKESGQ